jgi:hypothetical protein
MVNFSSQLEDLSSSLLCSIVPSGDSNLECLLLSHTKYVCFDYLLIWEMETLYLHCLELGSTCYDKHHTYQIPEEPETLFLRNSLADAL